MLVISFRKSNWSSLSMAALRCAAVMRLEEELRAMVADLVQRDIMKSSRALAV